MAITNKGASTLTAQQELFLEYLFYDDECVGDAKEAARKAGYAENSYLRLVKSLRTEILEQTQFRLALNAPGAASKLINMMEEDGTTPKADIRLKAIESVLDRTGVSKKQEISVEAGSDTSPIFFIPAKATTLDPQTEENTFSAL